jgi:hypothetical protein
MGSCWVWSSGDAPGVGNSSHFLAEKLHFLDWILHAIKGSYESLRFGRTVGAGAAESQGAVFTDYPAVAATQAVCSRSREASGKNLFNHY